MSSQPGIRPEASTRFPRAVCALCATLSLSCGRVGYDLIPGADGGTGGGQHGDLFDASLGALDGSALPGPCVPSSTRDTTCDGIDDDCDGAFDEDYEVTPSICGFGVCESTGELLCMAGTPTDTCMATEPSATLDDPTFPGNGVDDDCDGTIDEDAASGCDTTPQMYMAGAHTLGIPAGCTTVTVELWGGGGASGDRSTEDVGTPGRGGSGGYARSTLSLSGALQLYVGRGGNSGCGAGGTTGGVTTYNGGAAGEPGVGPTAAGKAGSDGSVNGGDGAAGAGGLAPGAGGRGSYGGGGGGAGGNAPWPPYSGPGGGGGAASVLVMNGAPAVVAGGGGGGGGMTGTGAGALQSAGNGGEGCSGAGGSGNSGGGGGGGGVCVGTTTAQGTDGVPANAGSLPSGLAVGGQPTDSRDCVAGGAGYAIIRFGI